MSKVTPKNQVYIAAIGLYITNLKKIAINQLVVLINKDYNNFTVICCLYFIIPKRELLYK